MSARILFLSAGLAALLAACASSAPRDLTLDADRHRPVVTQEIARLDLAPPYGGRVAPDDQAAIAAFLRDYRMAGHGPLVVATPSGENPAALADQVGAIAAQAGIAVPDMAVAISALDGGSPYNLTFVRYRAHAPECGQVWPSLSQTARSDMYANFGCAQSANLAVMIADPADLLGPRALGPADAQRRAGVLEAYRSGELSGEGSGGGSAGGGASAGAAQ